MEPEDRISPAEPIAIRDEDGQVILRVGLTFTLYFENGVDRTVIRRIGTCIDYFRSLVDDAHLRWVLLPDAERFQRIGPATTDAFHEWIRAGVPDYSWYTAWLGGRNPHEASEFQIEAFGKEGANPGYLYMVLPFDPGTPAHTAFAKICLRLCEIVKPYHGYGGLGFAQSVDGAVEDQVQPLVYALARRFPGIEVDRPVGHTTYLAAGIKGVNWLTVLGAKWIEKMGGVASLRKSLSDAFVFHQYDEGLMIQAGPRPQPGDVNQRVWPILYPDLARLLKPIRVTDMGCFDNFGANRFTRATTAEWLTRFDRDPF